MYFNVASENTQNSGAVTDYEALDDCVRTKLQGAYDIGNQTLFQLIALDLGFNASGAALLWDYIAIPASCSADTSFAYAEFMVKDVGTITTSTTWTEMDLSPLTIPIQRNIGLTTGGWIRFSIPGIYRVSVTGMFNPDANAGVAVRIYGGTNAGTVGASAVMMSDLDCDRANYVGTFYANIEDVDIEYVFQFGDSVGGGSKVLTGIHSNFGDISIPRAKVNLEYVGQ